ncbi:MAG: ABC transporter ATP-binding protein [Hyphomicrobiales bacterium]|jgi:branched-chain amino acid transport system ATP-binding protein|nr:ABC transporter ATP-binding protein [Hyphomicrobiales bacterium]
MVDYLRIEQVSRRFGGLVAVNDVSFSQPAGQILGIIGPNGAGKSTLFNMIAGMIRPTTGRIWFEDRRIDGMPAERIARLGIVKTFQTSRPFGSMTFLENVATAAFAGTNDKRKAWRVAEQKLGLAELADQCDLPARGASTGQRKRLEIARLLAVEPRMILLDEPFGGVDIAAIEGLIALLRSIREAGVTILVIEHNLGAVTRLADRLIAMNLGSIIAEGTPESVTHDPLVVRAYLGDDGADDAA